MWRLERAVKKETIIRNKYRWNQLDNVHSKPSFEVINAEKYFMIALMKSLLAQLHHVWVGESGGGTTARLEESLRGCIAAACRCCRSAVGTCASLRMGCLSACPATIVLEIGISALRRWCSPRPVLQVPESCEQLGVTHACALLIPCPFCHVLLFCTAFEHQLLY